MVAICKLCGKNCDDRRRNNAFYCKSCREVWNKKSAKRYQLGNNRLNCVWVRSNQIVKAVINGELVEPFYVLKEVVE